MEQKHALIIGGTGMLAGVSLWCADEAEYFVSVISRSKSKYKNLSHLAKHPDSINHLPVDYYDYQYLEEQVELAIDEHGPISMVISWTPSTYALELILNLITKKFTTCNVFHIQGSRRYFENTQLTTPPECKYHSIFLGFVLEDKGSRWLTHKEISQGVINCVQERRSLSIVGTLSPYDRRPR